MLENTPKVKVKHWGTYTTSGLVSGFKKEETESH